MAGRHPCRPGNLRRIGRGSPKNAEYRLALARVRRHQFVQFLRDGRPEEGVKAFQAARDLLDAFTTASAEGTAISGRSGGHALPGGHASSLPCLKPRQYSISTVPSNSASTSPRRFRTFRGIRPCWRQRTAIWLASTSMRRDGRMRKRAWLWAHYERQCNRSRPSWAEATSSRRNPAATPSRIAPCSGVKGTAAPGSGGVGTSRATIVWMRSGNPPPPTALKHNASSGIARAGGRSDLLYATIARGNDASSSVSSLVSGTEPSRSRTVRSDSAMRRRALAMPDCSIRPPESRIPAVSWSITGNPSNAVCALTTSLVVPGVS